MCNCVHIKEFFMLLQYQGEKCTVRRQQLVLFGKCKKIDQSCEDRNFYNSHSLDRTRKHDLPKLTHCVIGRAVSPLESKSSFLQTTLLLLQTSLAHWVVLNAYLGCVREAH